MNLDFFNELNDIRVESVQDAENGYIANAKTVDNKIKMCPTCHRTHIVKFGNTSKKYKDIPYGGKKVMINLKSKNFLCKECSKKFQNQLLCMSQEHQITQRLYDYIVLRCQQTSKPVLANETGVSRRVIQDLSAEFLELNHSLNVSSSVILVIGKWKSKNRMIILDAGNFGVIYCPSTIDKAIRNLITLKSRNNVKKLIIPHNHKIIEGLINGGIKKDEIYFDLNTYNNYIVSKVYEAYRFIRDDKDINIHIKTRVSEENKFFYKLYRYIYDAELQRFNHIISINELFKEYYFLKESILNYLYGYIANDDILTSDFNGMLVPNTLRNGMSITRIGFLSHILGANQLKKNNCFDGSYLTLSSLLDEILQDKDNIELISKLQNEKIQNIFNNVCLDLDNGVSEEWIQYKYSI